MHRQCGDIDVYIGKEEQPIANNILLRHGAEAEGETSDKHASYSFHGVHIENHRIILRINNPAGNRYFQRLIQEWYPQHAETREIHEYPVSLPPVTFNALYIFMHAFVHFLNSGIGLRQVCDWTRLLATRHEDIDKLLLEKYFRKVGLLRAAKAFGYIAVHYLGLPEDNLPFSVKGMERAGEILLDVPNQKCMLIDAGENMYGKSITEYINNLGYTNIDYLVATHPHADHIGSMAYVVKHNNIGEIYMPKVTTTTKTYENLLTAIADKGLKVKSAKAGMNIIDDNDFSINILAPVTIDEDNLNNCSVILKITYKNDSFLFLGDAEKKELETVTADMSAEVLKVGHHGSRTSIKAVVFISYF